MKTLFIVGHPTQFEGPMYQYFQRNRPGLMQVLFLDNYKSKLTYDDEMQIAVDYGIDLISGYPHTILPDSGKAAYLKSELGKEHYNLIIINGYTRIPFILSIWQALKARQNMALRLDTVEFNRPELLRRVYKYLLYRVFNVIFSHFFVTSSLTREFLLRQGVSEKKISFFSYVVDNAYFQESAARLAGERSVLRERFGISEEDYVILVICKLNPREAPWDLLYALQKEPYSGVKPHLLVVGDGPSRAEVEEFCKINLSCKVSFAGYVRYVRLVEYYAVADVFVHAAKNEPWGVSVQEAMASGLPVIASSGVGAGLELIEQGKNGFIYQANDIAGLNGFISDCMLKMPRSAVAPLNNEILKKWSYESTMNTVERVTRRFVEQA